MRKKIQLLLIIIFLVSNSTYSEDEAEIDLDLGTITSNNGLKLKYGPLRIKVFEANFNKDKKLASIPGLFELKLVDPTTSAYITSNDGKFDLNGKSGQFSKTFGYLQVGNLTGAEKPNDKIYFGADSVKYMNDTIYLKDSWLTTDFSVLKSKDRLKAGYHFKAEDIEIELDKQITLKNIDFFLGKYDITPFSFPWFRFNIRKNSNVPLFPTWGTDSIYGWNITTGVLWGAREEFYRGGLAPKFGDKIGLMIGRMENWFNFGKLGKTELNVTDWLFYKKADKDDVERNFDRWDINFKHSYSGENGYLDFNYRNATYNLISSLDDAIDKYFRVNNTDWKYIDGVPYKGGNLGFYNLDSELNIGTLQIKADVNLVSNKEIYGIMVANDLDDLGYGISADYDLKTNLFLKQETDRYSIGAYYNYLYDMTPGATKQDLQSRMENFGFNLTDREYKIDISYDDKKGNRFRKLNSWERIPNFSDKNDIEYYGIKLDYTPWTTEEYSIYNTKNFKAIFGEYNLYDELKYRFGYTYDSFEKKLSLEADPFRNLALNYPQNKNIRDIEYNRYENILYHNFEENRGYLDFIYNNFELSFAGGNTKETIYDREGIYTSTGDYRKFFNDSQFYEIGLKAQKLSLGIFGELNLGGETRFDEYKKAYSLKKISTDDSSLRYRFNLSHSIDLVNKVDNSNKEILLRNDIGYSFQKFSYRPNSTKNITKDIRLVTKENFYKINDELEFKYGQIKSKYTINYSNITRATNDTKKGETISQKLDFSLNENNSFEISHSRQSRYTEKNLLNQNHKDLLLENFDFNYKYKNSKFYFKNRKITSDIWKINGIDDSVEKITENVYGYSLNTDKYELKLEYLEGADKRIQLNQGVIRNKNKEYSLSYKIKGNIEHRYQTSYSQYRNKGAWNPNLSKYNSDVIYLSYTYKDKNYSEDELRDLATLEYEKDPDEITESEISDMKKTLEERALNNENSFFLGNFKRRYHPYLGDARQGMHASLMLQIGEDGFKNDVFDSIERLEARLFYQFKRIELGYIYNQKADYNTSANRWIDSEREHEFSLKTKIGKPTESYSLRGYIKFYDQLAGRNDKDSRSTFDGFGVEIGKEFGYYEWAIAYERDYSYRTKDYEWSVALQFRLLTFPKNNIFGIGASVNKKNKVSPDTYLFDGIKIDEID